MTARLLRVAVLAALASGCAAGVWVGRPLAIDDYVTARVRIYRAGQDCRVEVVTASETILTLPTRCLTVTHVARP
jgi:hypothetical protein